MDQLDVITIGRSSVDLYAQQIGGALEDAQTFFKSVGGCPSNIAIGSARLGLKSGLITRVGDEQMGRFIRAQLEREGVATRGVITDKTRLTALVLLAVKDRTSFPMIFVRENCADMALDDSDIDPAYIASAKAVLVTGTHLSRPNVEAASRKAVKLAKQAGKKVIFDIDYRPNLWGLAGHEAGEARYVKSAEVSARLQTLLPDCDLIVGTEEEVAIAGGSEDTLTSLRAIRAKSKATIVLKRGPMGCTVYEGAIPDTIDGGISGSAFPIEVYNVLGAGDAFMSGFLRGWLRGESIDTCATWANACGALVVSRLMCSPESPTFVELQQFLTNGSPHHALRKDVVLNHTHWATTRRPLDIPQGLMVFAMDHRRQLDDMFDKAGKPRDLIPKLKLLAVQACERVAQGRPGYGMLLDGKYGQEALFQAAQKNLWIARPVELPGSRPLEFEIGSDVGSHLLEWPVTQIVKCLCFYHPDDDAELKKRQQRGLLRVTDAARILGRELLIEIISTSHGSIDDKTAARSMSELYALGIKPDWWKLEPQTTRAGWQAVNDVIAKNDAFCRGVVVLGLDAPADQLIRSFELASESPMVRGFAIGRTIFADTARAWLGGTVDDEHAVAAMAQNFSALCDAWIKTRKITV
ncbi:MAG TPA: 5-dehydro-2-deoxygluconokinase [Magnetospirillaceae bacterium]